MVILVHSESLSEIIFLSEIVLPRLKEVAARTVGQVAGELEASIQTNLDWERDERRSKWEELHDLATAAAQDLESNSTETMILTTGGAMHPQMQRLLLVTAGLMTTGQNDVAVVDSGATTCTINNTNSVCDMHESCISGDGNRIGRYAFWN